MKTCLHGWLVASIALCAGAACARPPQPECETTPAIAWRVNAFGAKFRDLTLEKHPRVAVPADVAEVFARVVAQSAVRDHPPKLIGFASPALMAHSLSIGEVLISSGVWQGDRRLEPDEIAAMLAHELSHLEHLDNANALCQVFALAGEGANTVKQATELLRERISSGDSDLASSVQEQNHDREFAADLRGTQLLESAGFAGEAMERMLRKLAIPDRFDTVTITHPSVRERIRRVDDFLAQKLGTAQP